MIGNKAAEDTPNLEETFEQQPELSEMSGLAEMSELSEQAGLAEQAESVATSARPVRHRAHSRRALNLRGLKLRALSFPRSRRTSTIVGVTIAGLLAGSGFAFAQLTNPSAPSAAPVVTDKEHVDRADRGNRPEVAPPSATTPEALPSVSPTPVPAVVKETWRDVEPKRAAPQPSAVQVQPKRTVVAQSGGTCGASYYGGGDGFDDARTASGEIFNAHSMTAAHPTLAFGTWVRVTNLANGKSVDVKITDRGPYSGHRCIDLSYAAFTAIAPASQGVINSVKWAKLD